MFREYIALLWSALFLIYSNYKHVAALQQKPVS